MMCVLICSMYVMLCQAIMRPGRLEVHVEIGLPDEEGRLQIIGIHTR